MTSGGENRVTVHNFQEKFTGLARAYFRFDLDQVLRLVEVLQVECLRNINIKLTFLSQMPPQLVFNGYHTSAIEAVCISLHRLSSQCR